jgi:hypothetical protein
MNTRTRLTTAVALASALVLAPMLTGCGALEGIIEQATGGDVNVSIGQLPDGWPTEVPVINGDIIGGGTAKSDDGTPVWNVTIKVESEETFAEIQAQLEAAGFASVDAGELDGGDTITSGAFKNDTYGVLVAVTGSDGNFIANYTVAEGDPTDG